jgi:hypothetical protein
VTLTNASAITVTVAPSLYAIGEQINFAQLGAGQVTFQGGAGVTVFQQVQQRQLRNLRAQGIQLPRLSAQPARQLVNCW